MECKENYRRVMAACVRKVYDNDNGCWGLRLQPTKPIGKSGTVFWYPFHMFYMLSFGNLVVNPVHFLLTENMKRGYQGIILLFNLKYQRRWINVIFLQDKHNINAVSKNIELICIQHKTGERLCEPDLYPSFWASYTQTLYFKTLH